MRGSEVLKLLQGEDIKTETRRLTYDEELDMFTIFIDESRTHIEYTRNMIKAIEMFEYWGYY